MSILPDSFAEDDDISLEVLRAMSPAERLALTFRLSGERLHKCKQAIRCQNPAFTEEEVGVKFVELYYGRELAEGYRQDLERRKRSEAGK